MTLPITASASHLRGYAICTSPRSGSNFLCQVLTSTNALGRPLEYFNGPARRVYGHIDYPLDPHAQLSEITRLGATDNGIYGLKLFAYQFDAVATTRWPEVLPNLHFVHLRRADLLGQAISWARASQTEQYRSTAPKRGPEAYDQALINRMLSQLLREQARWDHWFARTGIQPLRLEYDEVRRAPDEAAAAVGALLGLPAPPTPVLEAVDLEIQRDATSAAWRKRFIAECGAPSRF